MSNYAATSRTNYFHVEDEAAFREWADHLELEIMTDIDDPGAVAIAATNSDNGTWPANDPDTGAEIDFVAQLTSHLQPGQVAILMEAGHERLCYVAGYAIAVDHTGDRIQIALSDIYEMARKHFKLDAISCAEY